MIDYYSILGLDRDCTRDEIKNAYRRLAKQYHPDVNKSMDAAEKFRRITEAYEYLLKVRDGEAPDVPEYKSGGAGSHTADGSSRTYGGRPVEDIIASLNSQDREAVRAAVEALGSRRFYDNMGVINILIGYLRSPDVALRRSAIAALGRIGNPIVTGDLAKMLRDPETQVRFEAIVAIGNIGTPMALTYLEMMDPDDPRNDALVMNARRETIYSIKKHNQMYPASRMCPFCGGYDMTKNAAPYKCHECGRTFGKTEEPTGTNQSQGTRAAETWSRPEASHDCPVCHRDGPLIKCEYCGKSFCRSHISPRAHRCWYTGYKPVEDRVLGGSWGMFSSSAIRNLAILAILLLLFASIGVVMIISTHDRPDMDRNYPAQPTAPTLRQAFSTEDCVGTWHYSWSTGAGGSEDSYLDIYDDNTLTTRQVLEGTATVAHGKWSGAGENSISFSYNDGIQTGRPVSLALLPALPDGYMAIVTYPDGNQLVGYSFRRISATPS